MSWKFEVTILRKLEGLKTFRTCTDNLQNRSVGWPCSVPANNLIVLKRNFVSTSHLDVEVFDCSSLASVNDEDSEKTTIRMKEKDPFMFSSIARDCCKLATLRKLAPKHFTAKQIFGQRTTESSFYCFPSARLRKTRISFHWTEWKDWLL